MDRGRMEVPALVRAPRRSSSAVPRRRIRSCHIKVTRGRPARAEADAEVCLDGSDAARARHDPTSRHGQSRPPDLAPRGREVPPRPGEPGPEDLARRVSGPHSHRAGALRALRRQPHHGPGGARRARARGADLSTAGGWHVTWPHPKVPVRRRRPDDRGTRPPNAAGGRAPPGRGCASRTFHADAEHARIFDVPAGTLLWRATRIAIVRDMPTALEVGMIPAHLMMGRVRPRDLQQNLFLTIAARQVGAAMVRTEMWIAAQRLAASDARQLRRGRRRRRWYPDAEDFIQRLPARAGAVCAVQARHRPVPVFPGGCVPDPVRPSPAWRRSRAPRPRPTYRGCRAATTAPPRARDTTRRSGGPHDAVRTALDGHVPRHMRRHDRAAARAIPRDAAESPTAAACPS